LIIAAGTIAGFRSVPAATPGALHGRFLPVTLVAG
jgi:hypothetical protein